MSKSFIGHVYGDSLLADSVGTTLSIVSGVQWSAWSVNEPRMTCVADALYLCGSWASCHH